MSMIDDQMCLVDMYLDAIEEACRRREFFSTHGGKIGIGLLFMQPRDNVCVFRMAEKPLILRKDLAQEFYKLRGAAYVPGIMYGEALEVRKVRTRTTKSMSKSHDTSALSKNSSRTIIPQPYNIRETITSGLVFSISILKTHSHLTDPCSINK